ncbi:hypothetical protein PARHAE_00342 [Paracoccus haematequi]|uniref:PEP-CTERM protein-sorting domain-containing protein n=1 Tax=Paracoccus haematequi TaxID=2491866 RepID=A0A447II60_9RHOB|nr:VPLPA-CTERM sorting domain-containing protein [Paracoccus haematequi]VDS07170.1 hypothetical protein PARHAE_00342 [Paracoccus haematequi]
MIIRTMAALSVSVVCLAGAASAATVVNGSFEDVSGLAGGGLNRGSFGVYDTIPGWTKGSGSGIELQDNGTLTTHDAQDGNWYVELDSDDNSSMYQDITFAVAGIYRLSFYYAPRTTTPTDNGIDYSLGGLISGSIDGVFPAGWQEVATNFSVNAGDVLRLTFAATGINNSLGGFVDNVTIAPVPLPASALLLGGAMAGIGFAGRRRRNRA